MITTPPPLAEITLRPPPGPPTSLSDALRISTPAPVLGASSSNAGANGPAGTGMRTRPISLASRRFRSGPLPVPLSWIRTPV